MDPSSRQAEAIRLMSEFARRTGIAPGVRPRRYLWTDAYAVLNFAELHAATGSSLYRDAILDMIGAVHGVLGRHRPDDPRSGWISGLPEDEGARHPTRGGLRIGKPLPERRPDEPLDDRLEWDRDGQYFHYLTRWMEALIRAAVVLDKPVYRRQAMDLAAAVLPPFLRRDGSGTPVGIAWKMSVDLTRPLVRALNPHDALDGYVTYRRLGGGGGLEAEIDTLAGLAAGRQWGTADPLGLGGLLGDAVRLGKLPDRTQTELRMIEAILVGADAGLRHYLARDPLAAPASRRLGFRELGLAIGLQAIPALGESMPELGREARAAFDSLVSRTGTGEEIIAHWADRRHQEVAAWQDHRDINEVMLATALLGCAPGRTT